MKFILFIDFIFIIFGIVIIMMVGSLLIINESKESLVFEREEEYDFVFMLFMFSRLILWFIKFFLLRKRVMDVSLFLLLYRWSGSRRVSGVSGSLGSNLGDYDDVGVGIL